MRPLSPASRSEAVTRSTVVPARWSVARVWSYRWWGGKGRGEEVGVKGVGGGEGVRRKEGGRCGKG